MSAATEQKNNGDVAVEKVAADAVKDDLKSQKAAVEDSEPAAADNGIVSKDEVHEDEAPRAKEIKAVKRLAEGKNSDSKKAKKENAPEVDSDGDEIVEEEDIESDEYDIPYDGEEDDIECEDDDDDSGSDDQA